MTELALELASLSPAAALRLLCERYPGRVLFSSSLGQEDQAITDLICREELPIRIFTLDTGRLFPETYELYDRTRARYGRRIEVYFPDSAETERFVSERGMNAFYESVESRKACCQIRKVHPLRRALAGGQVWVTGLRAEQSEARQDLPQVEWDAAHQIIKYHPLLHWSHAELLDYLNTHHVPYNPLHDKGFVSIGCAPCTRAIEPGEHPRAGRWWWEQSQKECGLHARS
jgi:phosphoadenosine phosphosulfate reductase